MWKLLNSCKVTTQNIQNHMLGCMKFPFPRCLNLIALKNSLYADNIHIEQCSNTTLFHV